MSHCIILGAWNYLEHSFAHNRFKRRSSVTLWLFSTSCDHCCIKAQSRFANFSYSMHSFFHFHYATLQCTANLSEYLM